ncbi:phosphohistidine phosphatase SixA [Parendozoicomonas haliclonae]|uniref:Phosphohistidine phosphatase SixA n=1 Tax=Parendozoicomonas haliclonae TaxID=1960125 RepID=A0A1X7AK23_9GAMM|nr:phosphohistidine phosphatase SixA [Parendozoicomonas haliclonae]SMA47399.1 Phosphohistidine phosphatase SixA [Parendozoicomonas haliclonae]
MKLFVMRHGQAEAYAASDEQRVLTEEGREEVARVAQSLIGVKLDGILCSPYQRARETAAIVAGVHGGGLTPKVVDGFTPDSAPREAVGQLPEEGVWLLVSHMPLVSRLTGLLVDSHEHAGPGFNTGMITELDMDYPAAGMAWLKKTFRP